MKKVSATPNSGQDFKGNKPPLLPLYYLPQVAIHGSAPVLILQPVMGSVIPTSKNKDVPYSSADTTVPFGPLIMPISPSVTTAEMYTAGFQPLQSNGCVSRQSVDGADKQTSLSQTTSFVEDENPDLTFSDLEEEIGKRCTGEVKKIFENNPDYTLNSPFESSSDVERWEESHVAELRKENQAFEDLFSMDLYDSSTNTMVGNSSEFTSSNPFAAEVENKVNCSFQWLLQFKHDRDIKINYHIRMMMIIRTTTVMVMLEFLVI